MMFPLFLWSLTLISTYALYSWIQLLVILCGMLQAVGNANFRYTGARMMNYLAQHLLSNLGNGNFRQQLMKWYNTVI